MIRSAYLPFVSGSVPDARLELRERCGLAAPPQGADFRSESRWALYRENGATTIVTYENGPPPSSAITYDRRLLTGEIAVNSSVKGHGSPALAYPGMEVLYIDLLSQGRGALLHASAINYQGSGLAFVGKSGAGKSTMARLWMKGDLGEVLCDDRIIARRHDEAFWIYGTPWHGDLPAVSPASVPLERLYFLCHDVSNRVRPLRPAEVVSRLMGCIFAPWWDREGMAFTLAFLDGLAKEVPCYELGFLPEPGAVDFVVSHV